MTIAITKSLFQNGKGEFKWLADPDKADRFENINLLAMTLLEPDEIWSNWEEDREFSRDNPDQPKRWRLKRRYLRAFEIEETGEYGIVAFEWGRTGWIGSTAFTPDRPNPEKRRAYFDRQRIGQLLFKRKD